MENVQQIVLEAIQPLLARIAALEQETCGLKKELDWLRGASSSRFYRSSRSHFSNNNDGKNQTVHTARSPDGVSSQFRNTGNGTNAFRPQKLSGNGQPSTTIP